MGFFFFGNILKTATSVATQTLKAASEGKITPIATNVITNVLNPGQQLVPNTSITSTNKVFTFGMGGDGNLWVKDNVRNIVLSSFNIANRGAVRAVMQGDGNFVVYDAQNRAIWASGMGGAGAHLVMQDDGNLVLYTSSGKVVWQSHTAQPSDVVEKEAHQMLIKSITPITPQNVNQWVTLNKAGKLSPAEQQMLQTYNQIVLATASYSSSPQELDQNLKIMAPIQDKVSKMKSLITSLMTQTDHAGIMKPKYWALPQLIRPGGVGWYNWTDTEKMIMDSITDVANTVNNLDLSKINLGAKKQILSYLLFPYVYFETQVINMSPYRRTHSDRHLWGAAQVAHDIASFTLNTIIPIINKLGFINLANKLNNVKTFLGGFDNSMNTGGHYPNEFGLRKLIDETYKNQSDQAAKSADFWHQVEVFGTKFWHSIALPTLELVLIFSGIMPAVTVLAFIIDIFANTDLNKQIWTFIGHMFHDLPFIGKWIENLLIKFGNFLTDLSHQIRKAILPPSSDEIKKARDEEEYHQLIISTDNELINFEKNVQAITKILNDWNSDGRDDLKHGLIQNINNRPNAKIIWASMDIIDKQLLGVTQ